jgi:predicted Zn-dependent peptidase
MGVIAVQQQRSEILPGVFLTCLRTDKFKTGLFSINFLTPLKRDTASQNTLIPNVLRRGTVGYGDMDALASKLDGLYGARIEPIARKKGEIQTVGFWADFVDDAYLPEGEHLLEEVAALLGQMILSPNTHGGLLRKDYVESEQEKLLEDIRARVNDKIGYSRYRLIELMCGAEDYAVDVLGTEDTAQSIDYVSLTRHYHSLLATSPVEIFYCGSAQPERVSQAMVAALAPMPRGEIDYDMGTDIRMNTVEEHTRYYTETMDVTQGKLAMGFRLGDVMDDPDMAALRVMNVIFGGGVSSKLFMNVREKLSLCYFASSALDLMKGLMVVVSGIETENYQTAHDEIFRQLEAVKAGDITPEELSVAKVSLSSDLMSVTDSAGELESFWLGQTLLGLDYGPEELAALVEDVTKEDVVKAASGIVCDMVYFMTGEEDDDEEA